MKVGDPGNCADCGTGITLKGCHHKYCTACAKDRQKETSANFQAAMRPEAKRVRHIKWQIRHPDVVRAKEARRTEKKRRMLQIARATIELVPELKELL